LVQYAVTSCLQVIPALDPNTPIYAGAFTMQLVRRRLQEFNLFNEERFHTFKMRDQFQAGPFE
jgi:mRNA degradation ribonuclease J1/J2